MFLLLLTAAASTAAVPPEGASSADRMICKSETKPNSRFTTRICHKKSEWDAMAESDRAAAREVIDKPKTQMETGN